MPKRAPMVTPLTPLFGAKRAPECLDHRSGASARMMTLRRLQMLDFMLPEKHAISILKKDHDTVKELFDRFEKTDAPAEKENIIARAVMELKIHATIEEEIFYPTVRKEVGSDMMKEADEEHHVARVLIA